MDMQQQQPPSQMSPGEAQQASPEEQELYNQFVSRGMMLIYNDRLFPSVVEMLKGEGDPVEGLARAASTITSRVLESAEKAGKQIPGDVVYHGGTELLEQLADVSERAGIKNYEEDPDALEAAFFRAADNLRVTLQGAGKLDDEAVGRDMAMLQSMNDSGELETMFRGLAANDPRSRGAGEASPGGLNRGMA